jgi:hypothetical protein
MQRRAFLASLGLGATAGVASANDFAKPPTRTGSATLDRWRMTLAGSRLYHIARLREYSTAGRFPRNHRIFGHIPVFIDDKGTPCAVGYLMQRSGAGAVATDISTSNNNVYVEKIEGGAALDWILFSGLTQTECAQIQPSYKWRDPIDKDPYMPTEKERLQTHFATLDHQLIQNTNASLDASLARLEPLIKRGASIDRVGR